jgi:hypothetical protein
MDSQTKRTSTELAETSPKPRRRLTVAFVVVHLLLIPLFAFPINLFPSPQLRELLAPYIVCIGLNEIWDTFAPYPKSAELYLKAVVTTADGKTQTYRFPRMDELSFFERYRKERYRKFEESVLCGDCSGLWPDIEKEAARRVLSSTGIPYKVVLVEAASSIDPKTGASVDESHAKPTVLSEQSVDPE